MSWVTSSVGARLVGERGEQPLLQLRARDRVEGREGLVEQQHGPVGEQRAGEGHPLAHPAGELVRAARARTRASPKRSNSAAARRRASIRATRPGAAAPARRCRARSATAAGGRAAASARTRPVARPTRSPGGRRLEAADHLEQRGLPAARRAHDPERLAGRRRENVTSRSAATGPRASLERLREAGDTRRPRRRLLVDRDSLSGASEASVTCSLRGYYPTGSKGQRREVEASGAISARLPASPPG